MSIDRKTGKPVTGDTVAVSSEGFEGVWIGPDDPYRGKQLHGFEIHVDVTSTGLCVLLALPSGEYSRKALEQIATGLLAIMDCDSVDLSVLGKDSALHNMPYIPFSKPH